uniref:Secreted protein n=1 Tax=Cacopsylla melanoneura TaxID=428564 RepID=A0A8D9FGW7_9HEMI
MRELSQGTICCRLMLCVIMRCCSMNGVNVSRVKSESGMEWSWYHRNNLTLLTLVRTLGQFMRNYDNVSRVKSESGMEWSWYHRNNLTLLTLVRTLGQFMRNYDN